VADLVGRLVEPGIPVVLGAARRAPQRRMTHARPRSAASLAESQMHGSQETFCGIPGASECPYEQCPRLFGE
jgi:hypothetical protein